MRDKLDSIAIALMSRAEAGDAEPWIHLLPAGTFRGRDGRGPYTAANAGAIINASREFAGKRQIPIDYDHASDLAAKNGSPAPAAGWINALQSRADGVWGRVQWTPRAAEQLAQRKYRYLSPVFSHDAAGNVSRLLRASLTNNPNLDQLTALASMETMPMDKLAELRKTLGLADDADLDAINAKVLELTTARQAAAAPDPSKFVPIGDFERVVAAGVLGVAAAAAGTFFDVINRKGPNADRAMSSHARLVGLVRDAYKDASDKVGTFLTESKKTIGFLNDMNIDSLRERLSEQSKRAVRGVASPDPLTGAFHVPLPSGLGEIGTSSPFAVDPKVADAMGKLDAVMERFYANAAAGHPNVKQTIADLTDLGIVARGISPDLANLIRGIIEDGLNDPGVTNERLEQALSLKKKLAGIDTGADNKKLGISAAEAAGQFDRFTKSVERQAAAQEAEALAIGGSVGMAAKLRTEFVLLEAAQQAGGDAATKYADKIKALSERAGAATQRLAELRLQSDIDFDRSQIGRDPTEAAVAARLRSVYGDTADLNGVAAGQLRVNEQLRVTRDLSADILSGGLKGIRADLQAGVGLWNALGNAGISALNKISDKLLDMAATNAVAAPIGGMSSVAPFTFEEQDSSCQQ
jgi:hypothetical protein